MTYGVQRPLHLSRAIRTAFKKINRVEPHGATPGCTDARGRDWNTDTLHLFTSDGRLIEITGGCFGLQVRMRNRKPAPQPSPNPVEGDPKEAERPCSVCGGRGLIFRRAGQMTPPEPCPNGCPVDTSRLIQEPSSPAQPAHTKQAEGGER